MLHKTRGIVLSTTDYGETSVIAKVYTELFGLQSYLVNSVRKKNPKVHFNVFQPLTPVEMVVYHKERPGLQRISEIKPQPPLQSISFDIYKTSLILFLAEVVAKSIKEEESNDEIFTYIHNSIVALDESNEAPPDFHLLFLIRLTRFLGFFPLDSFSETNSIFDLRNGNFISNIPPHPHYVQKDLGQALAYAIRNSFDLLSPLNISLETRRKLLDTIIEFYQLHIENFGAVKSRKVLEEIWAF